MRNSKSPRTTFFPPDNTRANPQTLRFRPLINMARARPMQNRLSDDQSTIIKVGKDFDLYTACGQLLSGVRKVSEREAI